MFNSEVKVRQALKSDVESIHRLVNFFSKSDNLLPLNIGFLEKNFNYFYVALDDENKVVGNIFLFVYSHTLAEIRSLCVVEKRQKQGTGTRLVKHILDLAREKKIKQVFTLTTKPHFFTKLGFEKIEKEELPEKIFKDCRNCPSHPNCCEESFILNLFD